MQCDRAFALHVVNPCLIPATSHGPVSPAKSKPGEEDTGEKNGVEIVYA